MVFTCSGGNDIPVETGITTGRGKYKFEEHIISDKERIDCEITCKYLSVHSIDAEQTGIKCRIDILVACIIEEGVVEIQGK